MAVRIEAAVLRNLIHPGIGILTGTVCVSAVRVVTPGAIFVARAPASSTNFTGVIIIAQCTGSNTNSTGAITMARHTATNQNGTSVITIAGHTGMGPNFDAGVIDRSTGMVTPDHSSSGRATRW